MKVAAFLSAAALFLEVPAAVALGGTAAVEQQMLSEARLQHTEATEVEKAINVGSDLAEQRVRLARSAHRWEAIKQPDVVRDAYGACASEITDLQTLVESLDGKRPTPSFDQQVRKHLAEDKQDCEKLLHDPAIARHKLEIFQESELRKVN